MFYKARPIHEVMPVVKELLKIQHRSEEVAVPFLLGPPGISKTANISQMCNDEDDWEGLITHWALRAVETISGLPEFDTITLTNAKGKEITKRGTTWTMPDILTQAYRILEKKKPKVLVWLLDDMHRASPEHQSYGYEMFSERTLEGHKIPKEIRFILAGNDSAKAGAKPLFSAVINRCAVFPVRLDFEDWKVQYALPNGINPKIIAFLTNPKNARFFQEEEEIGVPWASARSWSKFSTLLNLIESSNRTSPSEIMYYAATHLGETAAKEFGGQYSLFAKVDAAKLFTKNAVIKVPKDMSGQYIFLLAVVSEFFNQWGNEKKESVKEKHLKTLATIIIEVAKIASEVGVTGLKEIVLTEMALNYSGLYISVKKAMKDIDPKITKKLETDIKLI